jgi:glycosyltransferase involved in cell wall biosynthesis
LEKKLILIIGMVWPEPNSSAAGTRMLQLIDLFKCEGYEIIFASAAQESEHSFDLEKIGVSLQKIILNSATFDDYIRKIKPSIVLFDRYVTEEQYGWRVRENYPHALRILDTEDLHCLRLTRQKAVKKSLPFVLEDLLLEDISKREIASILRCDLSLIISEFEMYVLTEIFKVDSSLLFYLPLFYEINSRELIPIFDQRNDFVFIGNFLHEPNFDAVKLLKNEIWPIIRKQLPTIKLNIYGAYASLKVQQLHNPKENFLVHGRAQNSNTVIGNSKLSLAPMRFGAGLKGKLLESMQMGTPSITTTIGAEGISSKSLWNGYVTDDVIEFAEKAVLLYSNPKAWQLFQNKGFDILKSKFNKDDFKSSFFEHLNNTVNVLDNHRRKNFMGSMLTYHNAMGLKYMSLWIENKNKGL